MDKAKELVLAKDWPGFRVLLASSVSDAEKRQILVCTDWNGSTIWVYLLSYDVDPGVYNELMSEAVRLEMKVSFSQTDRFGCIPLHYALLYGTHVAVVDSAIKGTPTHLLSLKDKYGAAPLDYLDRRSSSLANTAAISALYKSAVDVSVLCVVFAMPTWCRPRRLVATLHRRLFSHPTSLPPLSLYLCPLSPSPPPPCPD